MPYRRESDVQHALMQPFIAASDLLFAFRCQCDVPLHLRAEASGPSRQTMGRCDKLMSLEQGIPKCRSKPGEGLPDRLLI